MTSSGRKSPRRVEGRRLPSADILALGIVVSLLGCGERPTAGAGDPAESLPTLTLPSQPALLRLGDDADGSGGFARIQGAVLLGDSLLVVADGQPPSLAYFRLDGALVGRAGSPGQGPGEFRSLAWIQEDPQGRGIWAYDGSNRRASLFSPSGELVDEIPVPAVDGLGFPQVVGILPEGMLLLRGSPADAPPREPAAGRQRFQARIAVAPRGGGEAVHLWTGEASEAGVALTGTTANPRMIQGPVPLAGELAVCVGADGTVAIAPHTRPEVHLARAEDARGSGQGVDNWTQQLSTWPEELRPVDEALFRSAVQELLGRMGGANMPPVVEETYLAMEPPEALPVNEEVLCAWDGTFWVGQYPEPDASTKTWRLLDSAGTPTAHVELPRQLRPTWVGEDRLLAVETDELGVERVLLVEWSPRP